MCQQPWPAAAEQQAPLQHTLVDRGSETQTWSLSCCWCPVRYHNTTSQDLLWCSNKSSLSLHHLPFHACIQECTLFFIPLSPNAPPPVATQCKPERKWSCLFSSTLSQNTHTLSLLSLFSLSLWLWGSWNNSSYYTTTWAHRFCNLRTWLRATVCFPPSSLMQQRWLKYQEQKTDDDDADHPQSTHPIVLQLFLFLLFFLLLLLLLPPPLELYHSYTYM